MPNIIGSIVVGLIAGWLAGRIMQGRSFGCLGNVLIGMIGAVIGNYVFDILNIELASGFINALLTALAGAVILLAVVNLLVPVRRRR